MYRSFRSSSEDIKHSTIPAAYINPKNPHSLNHIHGLTNIVHTPQYLYDFPMIHMLYMSLS